MKRFVFTLLALVVAAVGTALACNQVSYSRVSVGYAAPAYTSVSVVSPYTPTVSLPAAYATVAAAPCHCEQAEVAAPPAYEAQVAAPVVRSRVFVAAPQVYATPQVAVAASYGYANVQVQAGHRVNTRVAVVRAPTVRVKTVRVAAPQVRVVVNNQRRGLLGSIADRIRSRRGR